MTYRSKVDAWLVAVVLAGLLAGPTFAYTSGGAESLIRVLPASGFVLLVIVVLAWPVRYTTTDDALKVRSGLLLRWTVPFHSIQRVVPSRSALSSPAWSLDRLRIERTDGGLLLISPADKADFLQDLALRARMKIEGQNLVR